METSKEGLAQAAALYKNDGALPLRRVKTVLVSGPNGGHLAGPGELLRAS